MELRKIETRLNNATPAPWEPYWDGKVSFFNGVNDAFMFDADSFGEENAELVANAPKDIRTLLRIINEQEATMSELSSIYELQYGSLNQELRERLTKYERVVEAAKEISETSPEYEAGRHTLYQVYEPEMESLRDALNSLKA